MQTNAGLILRGAIGGDPRRVEKRKVIILPWDVQTSNIAKRGFAASQKVAMRKKRSLGIR